jgi:hypothetical protein
MVVFEFGKRERVVSADTILALPLVVATKVFDSPFS